MKINRYNVWATMCLLLKSIWDNQYFALLLFYFACIYVADVAVGLTPPLVVCLITVNSKWKYEKAIKVSLILLNKGIYCSQLCPLNLLVDADRYHFILWHISFTSETLLFSNVIFKKSSYYRILLLVGKKIKCGNSYLWYKRTNKGAFF